MTTAAASRVTVIVPAFNAERTVVRTLESLLAQTVGRPRVLVVDDGSGDLTAEVAAAAGAEVIRRANGGPGSARNTGIAVVCTEFVAFCDADDVWPSDRLELDLVHFADRPATGVLLGRTRFDADDESLLEGMHFDRGDRTALIPHFGACTARVAALEAVGPIAEDMPNYEDYDWFLRVRECGVTMVSHDRVSLHRRMHHGSTSQRRPASQAELLGALQRSLRRRRGSGSMLALPRLSDLGDRGAS